MPPPPNAPPPDANNSGSKQNPGQPPGQAPTSPPPGEQNADERAADNQRAPGQMSREEARELLDSVKGDERHSLGVPVEQRNTVRPPDKPYKNW
jgi:hypothetical protein